MEDPESEWEIQEYSSSKTGDGSTSMMRWMLNKGFVIGKKLVITGIAISSAPLVVPPLLVFSAMGVAFSVPFGLVFASYACTNKLMSTLLPTPPPPPPLMLEYYYAPDQYEQDKDEGFELDDVGGGDDYRKTYLVETEDDIDQQEKAFVTNVDEKVYYTHEEEDKDRQYVGASITNEDDNLDENGFYTNDDKAEKVQINDNNKEDSYYTNENAIENYEKEGQENVIEEEEREKMEDLKQGVEMGLGSDEASDEIKPTEKVSGTGFGVGVDDQGYEEDVGEYLEGDDDSLEEPLINKSNTQDVFEDEKEEIVKESTGLLEKIRDGGRVDESASNLDDDEVKDSKATEPVIVKEIGSQKLVKDGTKNEEIVGEMRHVVILTGGNEDNNFNSRELEELDLVASEVKGDTKEVRNSESDEKVMRESMGTQEKTSVDHISKDRSVDVILKTKKEHPIDSNSDVKEIGDQSGLDLVNKRDTNINLKNLEAGDEAKEDTADKNVDVLELPTSKQTPLATDDAKVASKTKTNMKTPSREDVLDDEKIWEKIRAMRKIVGYNAPSQPTCIGELKALYVFTGVEPSGSFKGDSDLHEVNAKLKFLMAIVGVK